MKKFLCILVMGAMIALVPSFVLAWGWIDTSYVNPSVGGAFNVPGSYHGNIVGNGYGNAYASGEAYGIGLFRSHAVGDVDANGNTCGGGIAFSSEPFWFLPGGGLMAGGQSTEVGSFAEMSAGPLGFTSAHVDGLAGQYVSGGISAGDTFYPGGNGFAVSGTEESWASYSADDYGINLGCLGWSADARGGANADGSILGGATYRPGQYSQSTGIVQNSAGAWAACNPSTQVNGYGNLSTFATVSNPVASAYGQTYGSFSYSGQNYGSGQTCGFSTANVTNSGFSASAHAQSSTSSY